MNNMIKEKKWNVCIIGAGTAGIGAAYALANYNLSDGEKMNVIWWNLIRYWVEQQ